MTTRRLRASASLPLAAVIILVGALAASAQQTVPMLINYQGELRDPATGEVAADGSYDMLLRIFDVESGGTAVWEGTYTSGNGNPIEVAGGIFSVTLGSGAGNALNASVFSGPDRWLEIQVGTDTLIPRQKITSVAYSIVSNSAQNADTVDGMHGADLEESAEIAAEIAAHAAIGDAHHERYTDGEAITAMGAKADENPLHHDKTTALSWSSITGVPAGFADEEDNDTTYSAGAGLMLLDSQFNVVFDGSGAADTASRSDHHHDGAYAPEVHNHDAGTIVSGILDSGRFSAYEDLATEGHLDGDAGTDLMTIDGGKGTYWALGGNGGTNPANRFVGTTDNQPLEIRVNNARALRLEPGASPNVIGGHVTNRATEGVVGAAVGGGGETGAANRVADDFGTVSGGRNNQAGDDAGTTSDRAYASVGGGAGNLSSGMYAAVGGGLGNQAMADYATIAGGGRVDPGNPLLGNYVFDHYGSIGGGGNNRAGSDDGDPTNATYATVGGGGTNWATGQGATVGGGFVNEASGLAAAVSGGDSNTAGADYATIGGGQDNTASNSDATVGGGVMNTASGDCATIGGGVGNTASNSDATVGGGWSNTASGDNATVGGGVGNTANSSDATVGGGWSNTASGGITTVGGGIGNTASGYCATVGGGEDNNATGGNATVAGGYDNQASGQHATVPGGGGNAASGDFSFAAGRRAKAHDHGAFVWADRVGHDFPSNGENTFSARCTGGARFVTQVDGSGNPTKWGYLNPVTASWEAKTASDRNLKSHIAPVDRVDVLERLAAVPMANWSYKGQGESVRHMGPMAQDFYEAFGLGGDDKSIDSLDADGVALAAIQGLYKIAEEKNAKISSLEARIEALETLVEKLVESQARGEE